MVGTLEATHGDVRLTPWEPEEVEPPDPPRPVWADGHGKLRAEILKIPGVGMGSPTDADWQKVGEMTLGPTKERVAEGEFAGARAIFNSAFEVAGERLRLAPHFGLALGSIKGAMDAAETARKQGRGWSSDAKALHDDAQFKQRLMGELDEALEDGSISVVFQPKIRLQLRAVRAIKF